MIEKLQALHNNSYSPYSKYPVSAIVVTKDGNEFTGVNVENASFGATICAERVAITSAIAKGYKKGDLKELYIMAKNNMATPCFMCRQVIWEFFNPEDIIKCCSSNGTIKEYKVSELCPYPFGEDDLK